MLTVKTITANGGRKTTTLKEAAEVVVWDGVTVREDGAIMDGDDKHLRITNANGEEFCFGLEAGMTVYVMNEAGATVETIRR